MAAPAHFVYQRPTDSDLLQGDVLRLTDELLATLERAHPPYFPTGSSSSNVVVVLTQTCDLVRRDGRPCDATHIALAPTVPLATWIEGAVARYQDTIARRAGLCSEKNRDRVREALRRLLNNNTSEFFYLHEEPPLGLSESCCASLRESLIVERESNYEVLLRARILSLTSVFQAKLGWLTGNIYSRVGTDDWVPTAMNKAEFDRHVDTVLQEHCAWISDKKLAAAKQLARTNPAQFDEMTGEELRSFVENVTVPTRRSEIVSAVLKELAELKLVSSGEEELRVAKRLENNTTFKRYTAD